MKSYRNVGKSSQTIRIKKNIGEISIYSTPAFNIMISEWKQEIDRDAARKKNKVRGRKILVNSR